MILHVSAKNARLILCFRVGTGKSVWFTSAEFYGFGKEGWEETERAFTACARHACDEAVTSPPAELPPCTSEPGWAESTDGHAHTQILYTSTNTGDVSDVSYSIYRRHWLDRMHLIIGVFLSPDWGGFICWGESQCRSSELSLQIIQCCLWIPLVREFVVARLDFLLCR